MEINKPIKKLFDISGRNFVISGSAGMLGKEFSTTMCKAGANVILLEYMRLLREQQTLQANILTSYNQTIFSSNEALRTLMQRNYNLYELRNRRLIEQQRNNTNINTTRTNNNITDEHIVITWYLFYQFSHLEIDYTLGDLIPLFNLFFKSNFNNFDLIKKIYEFLSLTKFDFI